MIITGSIRPCSPLLKGIPASSAPEFHPHTSAPSSQSSLGPLNHTCQRLPGGRCAAEDLSCPVACTMVSLHCPRGCPPLPLLSVFLIPTRFSLPPTCLTFLSMSPSCLPSLPSGSLRFSFLTLCILGCWVFQPQGLCSGCLSS